MSESGPMPLWTSHALAEIMGGAASAEFVCDGVAFDSREIGAGDLFFALKGDHSDGHHFAEGAFGRGAAGAIVSQPVSGPHICVADTMRALEQLGMASRNRVDAKIIGVTGSAGKTGTKEALYAALNRASRGKAHCSVKSYNNHVGVPLSLARMPADTRYGVFEMGMNHAGELSALTQFVRPHVAIITTIAPAHIEFFTDEAGIADAKGEIFEGLVEGGTAIIPRDNVHYSRLRAKAEEHAGHIVTFGFSPDADIRCVDHVGAPSGGSLITAQLPGGMLCYTLSQPGDYWIANSLAVLAAVEAVGADLGAAGLALAEMDGLKGRGARHGITAKGGAALLIDESYNANPASMAATIAALGRTKAERHVAILGTMKELGLKSAEYHAGIKAHLDDAGIGYALLVGEEMAPLAKALAADIAWAGKFSHCASVTEVVPAAINLIRGGDAILVKGSNSMGLSALVSALVGAPETKGN
jgi:UDP-N-acetylmuramoyl-tripeptide--D-alanyl-D-alanine ligase